VAVVAVVVMEVEVVGAEGEVLDVVVVEVVVGGGAREGLSSSSRGMVGGGFGSLWCWRVEEWERGVWGLLSTS
jgi:hypothetical protein